jgi:hypothetical protein
MDRIRPELGALFDAPKSIRAGENLFAWDSTLPRLSPVRFVCQVERRSSERRTSNQASGSKSERCEALPAGIFASPLLFNRAKQPPQQQWRIQSVLGLRITYPAGTRVREFAPQRPLRSLAPMCDRPLASHKRSAKAVSLCSAATRVQRPTPVNDRGRLADCFPTADAADGERKTVTLSPVELSSDCVQAARIFHHH